MNNTQRTHLDGSIDELKSIKQKVEKIKSSISEMYEEEEGKFENLSEGLQVSEVGVNLENSMDNLMYAEDALIGLTDSIEDSIDAINDAKTC